MVEQRLIGVVANQKKKIQATSRCGFEDNYRMFEEIGQEWESRLEIK